jgi:6,7-dimethyl-8-ribityllumazine synthase
MTSGPDISNYDPFEDTGDWPFRDAPPKPERDVAPEPAEPQVFENTELSAPIASEEAQDEEQLPPSAEAAVEDEPEPVEAVAVVEEVEEAEVVAEAEVVVEDEPALGEEPVVEEEEALLPAVPVEDAAAVQHAPGELLIPPGVEVLAGGPHGFRRNVAVVVSRFNGDITTELLDSALTALRDCNVGDDAITVVPVPGAFELPLTALALAKTRRYSCVVALGCIIRGETPHFDLIASEAASGLQLAAIETGIPVAFGVITTETREQAEERIDRGGEAARTALEMADLFSHVRTSAAAS